MGGIVVVFPKMEDAKAIRNLLVRHGFNVTATCSSGASALQAADNLSSGIVVCGYRFSDMLYSNLRADLPRGFEMLLVASTRVIGDIKGSNLPCITMPLKVQDLIDTLNMMERNIIRRKKRERLKPKTRNPEEQAILSEAKKILMSRNNMSEEEAHRYIQKTSMDSGNPLVETAEMIITIMHA
ncbi:MAG: ANTAR domain-containing protein [Lachnospiraceae bacterium]|nr:ANTAR domain-containing protein [Lachnospiraceae bacterium]